MEFIDKNQITDEDILMISLLRNPSFFLEFALFADQYLDNDKINPDDDGVFKHFWYQENILHDFNRYVSVRASRSAGKTVTLRSKIIWALCMNVYGKEPILFTAPNQYHLDPVWEAISSLFKTNKILKNFIVSVHRSINVQKHMITTKFGNHLVCRIAGEGRGGKNIIGLHVGAIYLDEAGYYPWDTFQELQPVLNKEKLTPGSQLLVAGTPSGERDKNVLFFADTSDDYSHHRMNAFMNPFYTEKDHENDIKQYGGKDTPEYIHFVLGEHGSPSYSLFDRTNMVISNYPVYKLTIDFRNKEESDKLLEMKRIESIPNISYSDYNDIVIGVDLGFTDPTAIYILKGDGFRYKIHAKIKLVRVPYPRQKEIITELLNRFQPSAVGIDIGSSGLHFYQEILEYEKLDYKKENIIPVNFSSSLVVGYDEDGKEIKEKVKVLTVNYLQRIVTDGRIIFSTTDPETISDLEKISYTKTPSGNIIYYMKGSGNRNKQDDHFFSALLCFSYVDFIRNSGISLTRGKRGKDIKNLFIARMV